MTPSSPSGTEQVTLRVTTYPPTSPRLTYRQLVTGLAFSVARVPVEQLSADLAAYAPLRLAVGHALATVETEAVALYGALLRLLRCLDDLAAGRTITPDRLALALGGVVRALSEVPTGPPTVANALERLTGNIAALSGRLIARY